MTVSPPPAPDQPHRERLAAQLKFLIEADKLKSVVRANVLSDGSRFENTAEHSWHLCLWAVIFADHAPGANLPRVLQMLLIHDLVEIDAGDHPIHLVHDQEAVYAAEAAGGDPALWPAPR